LFAKEIKAMTPKRESLWLIITALLIWAVVLTTPAAAGSMKNDWVVPGPFEPVLLALGPVDDDPWDITVDSQGNVYAAGFQTVRDDSTQMTGYQLLDSQGHSALWSDFMHTSVQREGFPPHVTLDTQENLYLSGKINPEAFFIMKEAWVDTPNPSYPRQLTRQWLLSQGGAGGEPLGPIAVDGDGNIYAGVNYKLFKFLPDGSPAGAPWPVTTGVANVTGIALDDKHVFITGGNFVTERHHKNGEFHWTRTLPPFIPGADIKSVALALDGQGNVFVTGTEEYWGGPNNVQFQIYTVKYSPELTQLWVTGSRGARLRDYHNNAAGLVVDGQGNAYVTGTAQNPHFYMRKQGFRDGGDFYTVKYAPDGTILWENYFNAGSGSYDAAVAIARDTSGNLVVTGTCKWSPEFPSTEPLTSQIATLCYSPDGRQQWVKYYERLVNGSENEARALAVRDSHVYVTGATRSSFNLGETPPAWNWVTIKYGPPGRKKELRPRP
jgi:hypothetical protein